MFDLQEQRNSTGRQPAAQILSEILYCCTEKKEKNPHQTKDCECYNELKRSETSGSVSQQGEFALDYHRGNFADPKMFAGANMVITAAGLADTGTQSSTMAAISSEFSWVSSLLCAN